MIKAEHRNKFTHLKLISEKKKHLVITHHSNCCNFIKLSNTLVHILTY